MNKRLWTGDRGAHRQETVHRQYGVSTRKLGNLPDDSERRSPLWKEGGGVSALFLCHMDVAQLLFFTTKMSPFELGPHFWQFDQIVLMKLSKKGFWRGSVLPVCSFGWSWWYLRIERFLRTCGFAQKLGHSYCRLICRPFTTRLDKLNCSISRTKVNLFLSIRKNQQ